MQQDLLDILVDIFKSSGYKVIISSQCEILVEKNGHQAYVKCALRPNYEEIKTFSEKVGKCTGIYVIIQKIPNEVINYAADLGIYIWDRDELALQIGKAVLTNIERKTISPLFEPETLLTSEIPFSSSQTAMKFAGEKDFRSSQEFPKTQSCEPVYESYEPLQERRLERKGMQPQVLPTHKENKPFGLRPLLQTSEGDSENPEQTDDLKIDDYEILNIHSVEPRITKDQAISIAKPHLSSPKDVVLKFVPFWKYKYNVDAEKRFRSKVLSIEGEGKGLLNALNKSREKIEIEGLGTPTKIPAVPYEIKRQNVDKRQAEKILLDLIIEENTRELRFNNMEGQAIIYEQRSIRPKPEEVKLDMELVYIPVWEIKGKRNSIEINAYNAKVLEEPIDEDAEFV
ncbi:MAG: hypothetical protein ACPK85_13815 [Methanosarcina sp.]